MPTPYKNKRFDYGDTCFSSPIGKAQYYNSYCMFIWKNVDSSRNFIFNKRTAEVDIYSEKDVFDAIINKLISDGEILPPKPDF